MPRGIVHSFTESHKYTEWDSDLTFDQGRGLQLPLSSTISGKFYNWIV